MVELWETHLPRVFVKRECGLFIASSKDSSKCACGASLHSHQARGVDLVGKPGEVWSPSKHTLSSSTDAYGTIDFLGGPHPNKAQYIRLGFDSRSDLVLSLLTREWGLELPKLLISVHGGKANFDLSPRLKKILRKGLLKAAKTTGAWLLTGGLNTGVTRHVGDALVSERSPRLRGGRVVSIGVAPWGVVENRASLVTSSGNLGTASAGSGGAPAIPYQAIDQPRSKLAVLNPRHAYFLLVDNGTVGRYGAEIALRRRLEKYISNQRLSSRTYCSIPIVCLVVEGGMHTIRTVLEYVTDSPPVPVVVVEGSGRAADLLAFAHRYMGENGDSSLLDTLKEELVATLQRTFHIDSPTAFKLYSELVECVRRKNLVTVFRLSGAGMDASSGILAGLGAPAESHEEAELLENGDYAGQELDAAILSALFRSHHLSAPEQLSLALAWNRVDMARSEIFVYGQEWPEGALDEAMMEALVKNRVEFVQLLLEQGVTMAKFLTIPRLEELYNSKQGPANTLRYLVRDVRPHMPRGYNYTLIDIGLVINKLLGGAYRSTYTRRKFRILYNQLMKKHGHPLTNGTMLKVYSNTAFRFNNTTTDSISATDELEEIIFSFPFNELFQWAVLTKRTAMAILMWSHGEEALAKALVACKLYRAMAHEAAEDDLEVEIYNELRACATEFETRAVELLDYCYRQDDDLTAQLVTCQLTNWSGQTCLGLAFACQHRSLIAHPCAQLILADLWMGGLRTRRSTNLKVFLSLIFPPFIHYLEFKSKEELQLMPQTEEEHLFDVQGIRQKSGSQDDGSTSSSSSNSSYEDEARHVDHDNEVSPPVLVHKAEHSYLDGLAPPVKTIVDGEDPLDHPLANITDQGEFPFQARKRKRQLRIRLKLYEFYHAPITKFWSHSMAYILFLAIYTYTVLVRMSRIPPWNECYIYAFIMTFGLENIREVVVSQPVSVSKKLAVWSNDLWNVCDSIAVGEFFIGLALRLDETSQSVGRVFFCLNVVYWYIRILKILSVSKFLGPFVTMMGKMVKNMLYFVTLLGVIIMAYGVFRQSLLFPNEEPSWYLARNIFFQPYFMIYGEIFADEIDPPCGEGTDIECVPGRFLNPLLMSAFLLMANILLLNLLIAVFNSIFLKTNVISHLIWKFQRFSVVMEYEQKPTLPPPFIIFSHLWLFVQYCRRRARGLNDHYDHGLKLFLNPYDQERLYDFEEECMEGLAREKETRVAHSTEERVRLVQERVESHGSKLEDVWQKETSQTAALQALDYRLVRLEEVAEQTMHSLSVIHRFITSRQSLLRKTSKEDGPESILDSLERLVPRASQEDDGGRSELEADPLSPSEFRRNLSAFKGKRGSFAFDGDVCEHDLMDEVEARTTQVLMIEDLALLKRKTSHKHRERCISEASQDGEMIRQAMEKEKPNQVFNQVPPVTVSRTDSVKSHDPRTMVRFRVGSAQVDPESGRKRNWSGTPTSSVDVWSTRMSGSFSALSVQEPSKPRLLSMTSCPEPHCGACQAARGGHGMSVPLSPGLFHHNRGGNNVFEPLERQRNLMTEFEDCRLYRHRKTSAVVPPSPSTAVERLGVEAEARHLRQVEGQDYKLMEKVIRRRLHRDSENLEASLEDVCNASIHDPDSLVDSSLDFTSHALHLLRRRVSQPPKTSSRLQRRSASWNSLSHSSHLPSIPSPLALTPSASMPQIVTEDGDNPTCSTPSADQAQSGEALPSTVTIVVGCDSEEEQTCTKV